MSESLIIRKEVVGPLFTNCYILKSGDDLLVIDPGGDPEKIIGSINKLGFSKIELMATHCHFDHIFAAKALQDEFGCNFKLHKREEEYMVPSAQLARKWFKGEVDLPDTKFIDEGSFELGDKRIEIILTPGHTPGSITMTVEDKMFTGDTLFRDSIGRMDIFGSEQDMQRSLRLLYDIKTDYVVYPGHGEETTLKREKEHNFLFSEFALS